jgi:hypothetical protein
MTGTLLPRTAGEGDPEGVEGACADTKTPPAFRPKAPSQPEVRGA